MMIDRNEVLRRIVLTGEQMAGASSSDVVDAIHRAVSALPATDAGEAALREAAEAWQAFKAANTTTDHFNAVERLDAILRALEEEGRDGSL